MSGASRGRDAVGRERIEPAILLLRGQRVMLDSDLATLPDFMFELTTQEAGLLRSQTVTLKVGRGHHRKYRPHAFTEQGVAMLSGVLRSSRAVRVNVEVMRAFVRLRGLLASNAELARKVDALEAKYDGQFKVVFDAIRGLMSPPEKVRRRIGF